MVKELPFTEIEGFRLFNADVDPEDLQWHWDEQHRFIVPMHDTDWKFQFDNRLPEDLHEGVGIYIEAGRWHRIIKGTGSLTISILKS